jgi:hypothetical protein
VLIFEAEERAERENERARTLIAAVNPELYRRVFGKEEEVDEEGITWRTPQSEEEVDELLQILSSTKTGRD